MTVRAAIHTSVLIADRAAPEPRSAATIAILAGHTLDRTLYELRTLEKKGAVRSFVDEGAVVQWVQTEDPGPWPWMPPHPPF